MTKWHEVVLFNDIQKERAQSIQVGSQVYVNAFISTTETEINGRKIPLGYKLLPSRINVSAGTDNSIDANDWFLFGELIGEPRIGEFSTYFDIAVNNFDR